MSCSGSFSSIYELTQCWIIPLSVLYIILLLVILILLSITKLYPGFSSIADVSGHQKFVNLHYMDWPVLIICDMHRKYNLAIGSQYPAKFSIINILFRVYNVDQTRPTYLQEK